MGTILAAIAGLGVGQILVGVLSWTILFRATNVIVYRGRPGPIAWTVSLAGYLLVGVLFGVSGLAGLLGGFSIVSAGLGGILGLFVLVPGTAIGLYVAKRLSEVGT